MLGEEELVSEVRKFLVDVHAIEALRGHTVQDQLAKVLSEAAAYIEESLVLVDQAPEDLRICRMSAKGKGQEAELTNTGIGEDLERALSLLYSYQCETFGLLLSR